MNASRALASLLLTLGSSGAWAQSGTTEVIPESSGPPSVPGLLAEPGESGSLFDRLLGVASALGRNTQRPVRASASSGVDALGLAPSQPGLALLCARGEMGALGLNEQCLLARLEFDSAVLPGYGSGVGVSGAWFIEQAGIDVNYGLSWLSVQQPQRIGGSASRLSALPGLSEVTPLHLALPHAQTDVRALGLGATVGVGAEGWLRIDGQSLRSQGRVVDFLGTPVPVFESDSLRFSAGSGAISGALTARVLELRGLPGMLNSLDLGISWRTPWRGELTVGATQYWTSGDTSGWPLRELPPAEESGGRVPYVRYQQDL